MPSPKRPRARPPAKVKRSGARSARPRRRGFSLPEYDEGARRAELGALGLLLCAIDTRW
jgi:hypothetical protein